MKKRSDPELAFDPLRRKLLQGIAGGAGAAVLAGCGGSSSPSVSAPGSGPAPTTVLPDPKDAGFDHVVVVMMENRSFDHYFGWLPGANGKQAGLSFVGPDGKTYSSHHLTDYQNCASADPDHSYEGGRKQVDDGKMDGFLLTQPAGDTFPIGYYTADDLPFFAGCAQSWTVCDRYFCGILSSTYPNRFYMHAGQTDRVSNTSTISKLPTVWDRMKAAGYSANYYYSDVPFTALWGAKYLDISLPYATFLLQASLGTLPNLSFVDPAFLGEGQGVSRDDHPLADIRDGQAFLNQIYDALRKSPQWDKTLLIINYDEWGGFFDHVEPPFAPVTSEEFAATGNDGRLGIRVPGVIIGPRARRGHVEHVQYDPNSILNLLAWRFGFDPLGARASSYNLAHALDFTTAPNTDAPAFDVPTQLGGFGKACFLQKSLSAEAAPIMAQRQAEHQQEWLQLKALAVQFGFVGA
ncbi:MAG: alkaline phosphatase family protein [Sinobacteraceae bacterium]|nr:alkaline phosphatase family protein [Nevskiaceae bacterium]